MRMTARSPKPYYALCLNGFAPALQPDRRDGHGRHEHESQAEVDSPLDGSRPAPPLIRFDNATLAYGRGCCPLFPTAWAAEEGGHHAPPGLTAVHHSLRLAERMANEIASLRASGEVEAWVDSFRGADACDLAAQWSKVSEKLGLLERRLRACMDAIQEVVGQAGDAVSQAASTSRQADAARQHALDAVGGLAGALDTSIERLLGETPRPTKVWGTLSQARAWAEGLRRSLSAPGASARESEIAHAFGIDLGAKEHVVLDQINLDVLPGQVVLLIGASGSGKTSLLNALSGTSSVSVVGGRLLPHDIGATVGTLDLDFPADVAVVDLVGTNTADACRILNAAGISEAKVYVRRRDELSHGQRYRVAAAILAASARPVWIADEFCAFLDPLTATMVSRGLARLARQAGATLIVAVADGSRVADGLEPDVTVRLSYGGRPIPDPQLQYWKHARDWQSRLDPATAAAAGSNRLAVDAAMKERDLVYCRLSTEHALIQRGLTTSADGSSIERRVADSLGLVAHGKWTETAIRRQVHMRARLWWDLHDQ
jgi:ABC-type lipoprotein export system ATPase subunit